MRRDLHKIGSVRLHRIPWFGPAGLCIDNRRRAVRVLARKASPRSAHSTVTSQERGAKMKTLTLTLFACSMVACGMEDATDQTDDDGVATDEQSIIGGTTDNGDACVVGVFAHAPGATS